MKALTFKKISLFIVLFIASALMFAASGGKKKSGTNKKVITVRQGTQNFSLRSGYSFKGGKLLQLNTATTQYFSLNSFSTIKKGNATYFVPNKPTVSNIPKLSATPKNSRVEVNFFNISLN